MPNILSICIGSTDDVLQMEIVVSEKYVSKVLTDEANFSFEKGVADVGNARLCDKVEHQDCSVLHTNEHLPRLGHELRVSSERNGRKDIQNHGRRD